jgi:hypothetical protein
VNRRGVIKAALAPLLLPLLHGGEALAAPVSEVSEIRIIQTKDPFRTLERVSAPGYAHSLAQSVLSFIIEGYPKGNLPVWKKPLSEVDLHSRIPRICEHVVQGVLRHAAIHPVDPCWIMGQMMAESFFCEFAVSAALAVGPCQFMAATARGYGMVCADSHEQPEGFARRPDLERDFERMSEERERMRALRREHSDLFNNPAKVLRDLLNAQAAGRPLKSAGSYTLALDTMELLRTRYVQARDNCRLYLEENFQDRSIFDPADASFLEKFDQRVLYPYCVDAMVRMMAENLRARSGNILAATAGYNAGLGNTAYSGSDVYEPYGRIPNISETVTYVSRILINHHEISRRMG